MNNHLVNRRPLLVRSHSWAKGMASMLASTDITPNQISVASMLFAALGAVALLFPATPMSLVMVAMAIQCRLICNLLDGMVAVEGGKSSATGELFNELPDRVSDSLLIVAFGHVIGLAWLGWLGALLAMMTAYIRVFGGALGLVQDFSGPMAKQQRMALMTMACLAGAVEIAVYQSQLVLTFALSLMVTGTFLTCLLRIRHMVRQLEIKGA